MNRAELIELLTDAANCQGLTQWDLEFCASMLTRVASGTGEVGLSEKQTSVLESIAAKVYA
jgi:hypothetical protein